eukprot:7391470-Prymnesium_polylepis.3
MTRAAVGRGNCAVTSHSSSDTCEVTWAGRVTHAKSKMWEGIVRGWMIWSMRLGPNSSQTEAPFD